METTPRPETDRVRIARALLLVQAGVVAAAVLESAVIGATSPSIVSLFVANLVALAWTLRLRAGIGRGSERARRWARRTQVAWLVVALLDLVLAVALAQRGLEAVALATRVVLPLVIRHVLRDPLPPRGQPVAPDATVWVPLPPPDDRLAPSGLPAPEGVR